jgi:tripartite-type tricarboxylate transporter receptor subunit TctC
MRPLRFILGALLLIAANAANAQTWPNRPIKLIVPTGPGAATDVMARMMSESVSRALGQQLVVENLPGASGIIAHQAAARAAPDGYTFIFTNTSGLATNPVTFKTIPSETMAPSAGSSQVATIGSPTGMRSSSRRPTWRNSRSTAKLLPVGKQLRT